MNFVTSVFKKYINKNEGKRDQQGEKTEQIATQSTNVTLLEQDHFIPGQSSNEIQKATPSNDEDHFHDAELNPTSSNSLSAAMVNNDEYSLANTDLKGTVSDQTLQESIKPNSSNIENRISKNEVFKDALNKNKNLKLISPTTTIAESDSLNDSMVDSLESVNVQEEPLKHELADSIEIIQQNNKDTTNDQEIEEYESLEHITTDSIENLSSLEQLGNNSYTAKPNQVLNQNNKQTEACKANETPNTPKKFNEKIFDETIPVSLSDILFDSSMKKSASLETKRFELSSSDNITCVDTQNNIEVGKADNKNMQMHEVTLKDTEQKIIVNTAKMPKDEKEIIRNDEVVNISIQPETQEKENQKRKRQEVDENVKKPRIETITSQAILESPVNEQINELENVSLNNDDSNKELEKALKSGDTNVKSNTDEKNQEKLIMGIEKTLTKMPTKTNEKQNDQEVKEEKIIQETHESKVKNSKPVVKEQRDQNSVGVQNTNSGEIKVIPECDKKIETKNASENQSKGELDNKSKMNVKIAKEITEDFKNVAPIAVKIEQDELVIAKDTKTVLEQNCDINFERQDTQEFEKLEKQFQETLRESDINVENLPNNVPESQSLKLIAKEETNISNIQNLAPVTTELKQNILAETSDTETALAQNCNICYERQDTQEFEKLEKQFKENSDNIAQLKTDEIDKYLVVDKTSKYSLPVSDENMSELPNNTSEIQHLKLVPNEMVDEKTEYLESNISNIQNSALVVMETKQEKLTEVGDTENILEPNSNLNFEKQETQDLKKLEKQYQGDVEDVNKLQPEKSPNDLVGENKPRPNSLHKSNINVTKLANNLSENQNLESDQQGKNKNIIVDVNKESLESKNSNIQILESVATEIKQNKLVEVNDIEKIIEQTRNMALERKDIQEFEKLEHQFKENLENKNEIIDIKKESLEESCTSSTEVLKDQKAIRETERKNNKEGREQLKPTDETKNGPLTTDNKNSKKQIKTHINKVNCTSKDAEASSTKSAVATRELDQIIIINKSDKGIDQTEIIFERQDTREFEKLEKQCKEDVPSGSNFESQKCSDNLKVNDEQATNEVNKRCEIVFENQNTDTFKNLEKPCVGNVDTDAILDQLVTESNANNANQQLEMDINYQKINIEIQSNKTYDRQDTREFELMEKQCIENVENSDTVLKERNINYMHNKTDISAELAVDNKDEKQNTDLENKIEVETFYPPTEGKPKIGQKETKNTNFIKRDPCEETNIIYDRQDTQEFENLERQCIEDIKKPNLKTDDILEQLVAESTNDTNAETKNLKISMEQEHKIVNTVQDTSEEIYDTLQGERLQTEEIVYKEIKPKQSLESENIATVETGHIEGISSVKDSICISTNSIEDDSSNSVKTVICCTKQTSQNDDIKNTVDTNCEGTSKSEETKDVTTQNILSTNESKKKDNKKNDTSNKSTRNFKKEEKLANKMEVQPNITNSNNKAKSRSSQEGNELQRKDNNINELACNAYENRNNELKNKVDELQQELDSIKKLNRGKDQRILSSTPDKQANKDVTFKYKNLLKEYEKYIMQQTKDLENLKMESESNIRNFTNTEMAFSDVFEKYEKTKFVIAVYRKNEDILLENIQNAEEQLSQVETKCLSMKQQSVEQIKRAHEQMEQEKRQYKQEINKLQAQVKRLEIKASSLEVELKQKTDECQALAALCDDITGRT